MENEIKEYEEQLEEIRAAIAQADDAEAHELQEVESEIVGLIKELQQKLAQVPHNREPTPDYGVTESAKALGPSDSADPPNNKHTDRREPVLSPIETSIKNAVRIDQKNSAVVFNQSKRDKPKADQKSPRRPADQPTQSKARPSSSSGALPVPTAEIAPVDEFERSKNKWQQFSKSGRVTKGTRGGFKSKK